RDKMGDDDFAEGLRDFLDDENKENVIKSVFTNGYRDFINKNDRLDAAIAELDGFMELLRGMGVKNAVVDLSVARGLAYYTGLVFEFKLLNHPELGTAAGGGRYANLAEKFSKTKIIGVGAAIGFSRIFAALLENNQLDLTKFENPIDVAVLVMGNNNVAYASRVVRALRDENIATVSYLDTDKKFKNQIEYADKIRAKFSIIIGDDESKNQVVALKDMMSGNQENLTISDAIKQIKAA
ncbi:MAG: ATP phosphoribosyltransferase regulatory subunit, partial [Alphaproteobacteria bacterium]|nr:ATP phosphoribosyltransferase regulatory subunit [Alphaproteobacteria bacterium]